MKNIGMLRSIKESELELMRSWRNSPNVRENMYTRHVITPKEHYKWWMNTQAREDQLFFMYELSGVPMGIVSFTSIDNINKNSSWAFYASPEAPKGSGTKMEFLALDYAFNEIPLYKLHCEVLAFNSPVIRLHQKFGFKVEGIFREHHIADGTFVDVYRLGLLSSEWQEKRHQMEEKIAKFS